MFSKKNWHCKLFSLDLWTFFMKSVILYGWLIWLLSQNQSWLGPLNMCAYSEQNRESDRLRNNYTHDTIDTLHTWSPSSSSTGDVTNRTVDVPLSRLALVTLTSWVSFHPPWKPRTHKRRTGLPLCGRGQWYRLSTSPWEWGITG